MGRRGAHISLSYVSDFRGGSWLTLARHNPVTFWRLNFLILLPVGYEKIMKNAVIATGLIASLTACSGGPIEPISQPRQTSNTETLGMVAAGGALIFVLIAVNASKAFEG